MIGYNSILTINLKDMLVKRMQLRYILVLLCFLFSGSLWAQNTLDKAGLTSSTLPQFAYSLRKLSSSYTGPLVRIYNGTTYYDLYPDLAGGISLSSKISASISYATATSAASTNSLSSIITNGLTNLAVAIWYDQSGAGLDMKTASTNPPKLMTAGSFQLLNGKPTIYFAGVSANTDFLRTSQNLDFTNYTAGTYSLVIQNVASTNVISGIVNMGIGGAWGFAYSPGSPYGYYVDGSGCMNAVTGELTTDAKQFTAFITKNVSSYIYENGTLKASKTTSPCNFTNTASYVSLGTRDGGGTTRKFEGKMSEIIFFPTNINSTAQSAIEGNQLANFFDPSVRISSNAASNTICAGDTVTFTATANNASNPTFQWKKNGSDIVGQTAATYTTNTLANNDVITVSMSISSTTLTSSIISDNSLKLKLDATDPASYSGTGTTWTDLSGNNNHATLTSHQSYDAGGSILFDGTNNPVSMPLVTNRITDVTMQSWVYLDALTVGPFMKNGINQGYSFGTGSGGTDFGEGNKATMLLNVVAWQPLNVLMGYGWKLVTMTISGTTESLYVNDLLIGSRTGTSSVPATGTYLGTTVSDNSGPKYFNSRMAAAFIYDKALSASEIRTNYNSGRFKLSPATINSNEIGWNVTSAASASLSSATGTDAQSACINSAITSITYTTSGVLGVAFSGLPTGVTGAWSNNVITISGTPSATGTFNYSINLTGTCGNSTKTGSIQVNAPTISLSSAAGTNAQSLCRNETLTNITYATTNVTGASFSGLPNGVTGAWSNNVVTLSGTPTVAGTYTYTINLTGGCGSASTTGTITVLSSTVSIASDAVSNLICYGTAVTFTATVTNPGNSGVYQWYKNGTAISGETSSTFTSSTLLNSDAVYVNYSSTCSSGGSVSNTGLIQHLDATDQNSYAGTGTRWTDLSGNNNHGTLNSAVFTNSAGQKYFSLANTYITAPLAKTTSMTFSSWAKTNNPSSVMLFNAGNAGSGPDLFFAGGKMMWNIWDAQTSAFSGVSTSMIDANFHQYTVVVDAVANNAKLYFDGEYKGVTTYWSPLRSSATALYIGGAGPGDGWNWSGGIRDFLSYNRALSAAEVTANYNATLGSGAVSSNTITTTVSKISLTSAVGTDSQTKCISTALTNVVYAATGASGATVTGLPSGVNWSWSSGTITISGTPTASGTFNYTITLTGGCSGTVSTTGTLVINPANTITRSSATATTNQTLCINTALTSISYATTAATGATFAGLPTGVTGSWMNHVVTISGTPTNSGTFNYTVTLTGGCGTVTTTGTIVVNPINTMALSSAAGTNAQSLCINSAITNITYSTVGATNASVSGLPDGVTGVWSNNVVTISGTATTAGNYTYTVSLSGGCGTTSLSGTILVKATNSITLSSATNTDTQSACKNANIVSINYTTSGATGATFSGLPAGVSGSFASNAVSLSGASTAAGVFNYTVTPTGGCGLVTATGTITVIELPVITVAVSGNSCVEKSTMTATNGYVSYVWYKDNVVVSGATLRTYSPSQRGTFKVLVSDGVCSNTSASIVFFDCGLTSEGNIVPTTSTVLVNNAGGTNNGTGVTDEGKILNITATTTIDVIETAASGATLVLNLDARNVNSLARGASPGTWYDLSGNQNNATVYGTVAYGSGNGGALNFPGGNANYVQAKSGVYFNGGSFTIQSWVYPVQLNNWNRIIDFGNGAGSNNILLSNTYGMSGNPGLYVEGAQFQSSRNLTLNAWHHVCATFDTNTRIATIYVDGQAAGSSTVPRPANVTRNNCYIGRSNWGFGDPNFAGGMGALQIYNGFLTATEILSNYNTTKSLYGL